MDFSGEEGGRVLDNPRDILSCDKSGPASKDGYVPFRYSKLNKSLKWCRGNAIYFYNNFGTSLGPDQHRFKTYCGTALIKIECRSASFKKCASDWLKVNEDLHCYKTTVIRNQIAIKRKRIHIGSSKTRAHPLRYKTNADLLTLIENFITLEGIKESVQY